MKRILISTIAVSLAALPAFAAQQAVPGVSPDVAATLSPSQLTQIRVVQEEDATTLKIRQRVRAILANG